MKVFIKNVSNKIALNKDKYHNSTHSKNTSHIPHPTSLIPASLESDQREITLLDDLMDLITSNGEGNEV